MNIETIALVLFILCLLLIYIANQYRKSYKLLEKYNNDLNKDYQNMFNNYFESSGINTALKREIETLKHTNNNLRRKLDRRSKIMKNSTDL